VAAGAAALAAVSLLVVGVARWPAMQPTAAVGAIAGPGPPAQPCIFPEVPDLARLANASDIAAVGTVGRGQVLHYVGISQAFTRYTLRVQSVLRQKGPSVPNTLIIEEAGGMPVRMMQPGSYVLFLVKSDRTDGLASYFVADGLYGAFPVRAGAVYRECPNYESPATLAKASGNGQGMLETDFSNEIRDLPALPPPPHK
jgi:hypothetical protein